MVASASTKKHAFHKAIFSSKKLLLFALLFGLIGGYILLRTFASPNPNLPGDLNGDNTVGITDLSILLSNYNTTNPTADINLDGTVNILDLSILLSHWGQSISAGTAYVSDLAWTQVANGWGPVEKDTSNGGNLAGDGKTLTLNGTTYTKGLGTNAYSEVNVPINSQYTTFTASVGIDDEITATSCSSTGKVGSVVFQVFSDGTKLFDSGTMGPDSTTQSINVNISGKTQLKLIVTDAGDGASCDHGDWANAQVTNGTVTPPPPPPPAPPPPPPSTGRVLRFPAAGHEWGGNSATAMTNFDFVVASDASQGNPNTARANGNPNLIALFGMCFDPFNTDYTKRRCYAFTYGGGLSSFTGVNDTLSPNPQGQIRGFQASDNGCKQTDGLQGFALDKPATADFIKQASYYSWKLGQGPQKGWDGIWSDNLVPGNLIHAGWFYGSPTVCPINESAWDVGFKTITNGLRSLGIPIVGGNVAYRASDNTVRASTNTAMHETLHLTINAGPSDYAYQLGAVQAWEASAPGPHILIVRDTLSARGTQRERLGLALCTILGGAYQPFVSADSELWEPTDMLRNGQRNWLGLPTAAAVQVGSSAWKRTYQNGTVYANMGTSSVTIDGNSIAAQDGLFK